VEALTAAKAIMQNGHYPFVPQLNRLISGRTDQQWENYFKMWLLRCEVLYLTQSFRQHERIWAADEHMPIVRDIGGLNSLTLPPFGELGRKFGEQVARQLPEDERWRKMPKEEVIKDFERIAGLGSEPLVCAAHALRVWDRKVNG
jgi:hypothetical protein